MGLSEQERDRLAKSLAHTPCSYLDLCNEPDLYAVVESIVASRERAAAERAWDEGRTAGVSDMSRVIGWGVGGCVPEHAPAETDNPYRAGEIRNGK